MSEEASFSKRWWHACRRLDRPREAWTGVAVVLGFLLLDSIPLAAGLGAAVWAAFAARDRARGAR